MEREAEQLSETIGLVYDAVVAPDLWTLALEGVCGYVGAVSGNVFRHDRGDAGVEVFHSFGEDLAYTRTYADIYRHMNPYFPAAAFTSEGAVFSGADLLPHAAFMRTRFYREWVRPQGFIDLMAANLLRTDRTSAFLSLRRSEAQGFADAAAMRRVRLVTPHIRRAMLVGETLDGATREADTVDQLLETISAAVFLLDPDGVLVRANEDGDRLLGAGVVVRSLGLRLVATDPEASRRLAAAVRCAGSGDAAVGDAGVAIPLGRTGAERWYAHVFPLAGRAGGRSRGRAATVAVFVRQARLGMEPPLAIVSRLYALTPAEVRVLNVVVDLGGGVKETAAALALSPATVRAHLREIFAKTGVRRQAELVGLLAAYQTPAGPIRPRPGEAPSGRS